MFTVYDGTVVSEPATVSINIDPVNDPPRINSTPVTGAAKGLPYHYTVTAAGVEGDRLSFSLITASAGMMIDPATGMISWTPSYVDAGNHNVGDNSVTVRVEDTGVLSATQTLVVAVADVNDVPVIADIDDQVMNEGATLTVSISSSDMDGLAV
jgi:phosphatidate phosphatase APP1